jgi:diacylglycerol O-acyltransferase / wax synthase
MSSPEFPDQMNPTDATLWEIERDPQLRTTIVGLGVLDRAPEWDVVRTVMGQALTRLPRLRQRVVEQRFGVGPPRWVDTEVDLAFHLRRIAAPAPADLRTVLDLCGPLAGEGFDPERPLWGLTFVEGLEDGRAAMLLKVHHSLTDGVGGMRLLRALADEPGDERRPARTPMAAAGSGAVDPAWRAVSRAAGLAGQAAGAAAQAALRPDRAVADGIAAARSAAKLLAPAGPPLSPLLTGRGLDRWTGVLDVSVDDLRAAAHRVDGTLNDAFVAAVLGALDRYHRELGHPASHLRVTMPVSSRKSGDAEGGNRWAPVRMVLPLGIDDPLERIEVYHRALHRSRREPALGFSQVLAGAILELPPSLTTGVVAAMVKGSDACVTDVPGLREPITIGGAALERLYPFAPTGGAAVNVGFLSHLGVGCVGLNIDTAAVEDPARLHELTVDSFDRVVRARRRRSRRTPAAGNGRVADTPADAPAPPTPQPPAPVPPRLDRLSALDTSFLRMESPTTPMHIGALYLLEGGPLLDEDGRFRLDEVRRHVESRLARLPRLTKRVLEPPFGIGRPVWVDDLDFDVAHHVRTTTLPAPGDESQLLALCEQLHMERLDRSRPLWELWFVPGLSGGRVGLVEKVHHALIDGVSGVELVTTLFDFEQVAPSFEPVPEGPLPEPAPGSLRLLAETFSERIVEPTVVAGAVTRAALRTPRDLAAQLTAVGESVLALARPAVARQGTSLNQPVGPHRRLLPVTVDLDDVHATGQALGGTINDVVLAAVTAGLRQMLVERGEALGGVSLHALVPKSTRRGGMSQEPGNHVAAFLAELPIGDPDPLGRLHTIEARMRRMKDRHQAEGSELLLGAGDLLPAAAVGAIARLVSRQRFVNLIVTNIPGPPVPLYFAGAKVIDVVPIVPLGGNLTVALAVVSYDGRLTIALHGDREACPDLPVMADAVRDSLAELAGLAGVDWHGRPRSDDDDPTPDGSPADDPTPLRRRRSA